MLINSPTLQSQSLKGDGYIFSSFNLLSRNDKLISLPKPCIMGIINVSPNSFFRPYPKLSDAIDAAASMVEEGASILDIGGEATNPKVNIEKDSPNGDQEIERVLPLIEALNKRFSVLLSVDTSKPDVIRAAVQAGADMVNDQRALINPESLQAVAKLKIPVCLMHFFNSPRQPNQNSKFDLLTQIKTELSHSVNRCLSAGINPQRIIIDPGFGQGNYGKNCTENFYLLAHLTKLTELGYPVLVGWSRKSMIGEVLGGVPADQRLNGSIVTAAFAALKGAAIIRVHDVAETKEAVQIAKALLEQETDHQ